MESRAAIERVIAVDDLFCGLDAIKGTKMGDVAGGPDDAPLPINGGCPRQRGEGTAMPVEGNRTPSHRIHQCLQDDFVGIGVVFDTFKNTEHLDSHRDVTVLINNGEKTWEMMTESVEV